MFEWMRVRVMQRVGIMGMSKGFVCQNSWKGTVVVARVAYEQQTETGALTNPKGTEAQKK